MAPPAGEPVPPAVSVVIATRNRAGMLGRLLDALASQTAAPDAFEVVVVDDASSDETADVLARHAHGPLSLRAMRHPKPLGPASGRDDGWRAARAPLIAFTDDDCVPGEGWVGALLAAARRAPGAVVMGRTRPDPAGRQSPFTRTVVVDRAGPPYETCNILYPRALLEQLDGFDRSFPFPVGEDTDLGWRAVKAGAEVTFAPEALVHHAIHPLGPRGNLEAATRFRAAAPLFRRHPELRAVQLHRGIFWSPVHEHLLRALVAALLPRRLWPLSAWLAFPYAKRLVWRRSGPLLAPYILLYDLVETAAVVRGAIDESVPMI
jgi:GT2 family glycosyltransferase